MKVLSVQLEKRCRSPEEFPRSRLPEVAFSGRSNVGKSSLINALLNRKGMVKVSSSPGKTRTIDFFSINDALRFVDLPGYGYAEVPKAMQEGWKFLVESYLENRRNLAAVVWILDIRRDVSDRDWMLWEWLYARSIRCIPVCTKADKFSFAQRKKGEAAVRASLGEGMNPICFSSRTGLGKDSLWREIHRALASWKTEGELASQDDTGP